MCEGGGNCLKYFKKGWNRKKGRGSKDFNNGGQAGSRDGCLKRFSGTSPTDVSPTDSSPTNTSPTDTSPTRHIPDGHFPNQTHSRRIFPQPDTSPTDTSLTRHITDGQFPDQTHPRWTFPRPDKCPTDICLSRCIPLRTFARPVKYLK